MATLTKKQREARMKAWKMKYETKAGLKKEIKAINKEIKTTKQNPSDLIWLRNELQAKLNKLEKKK